MILINLSNVTMILYYGLSHNYIARIYRDKYNRDSTQTIGEKPL